MKKQKPNSKKQDSLCECCKGNKPKRIIEGFKTDDGEWVGYDTKYNPYGKVVIKDKNGKVVALQG